MNDPEKTPEVQEDFKTKYQYLLAEYQNQAKRFQKEKEDFIKFSQEKLITELLIQMDSFNDALKYIKDPSSLQGVMFIQKNLENTLVKFGLNSIESAPGTFFDPYLHEAIEVSEEPDFEPQMIVKEIQKGYKLFDKVIRAAKVVVKKSND